MALFCVAVVFAVWISHQREDLGHNTGKETTGSSASIVDSSPETIPDYSGDDVIELNGGKPYFKGSELLARGLELEACSLEDKGKGVCFHVFVYNVQPGIEIDYDTGRSKAK